MAPIFKLDGTDNIGGYACGLTSMSIVVSSLAGQTVDLSLMAKWAYENGYWCSGNGSYHSLIPGAAKHFGLSCESIGTDEPQKLVDALSNGKLVVALMVEGHFTSGGHYIVLRGVTTDGKIFEADPASFKRSNQAWDISIIIDEARHGASAGGPLCAID
ncbi:C39 family peptidase [Paenibacillus sp. IHBB 3054]|uniref:C39 family peptidase n=1 Tax=Paenibacillus sp. IHBB 3054 TaxID=3425689 RepID=UPI003F66B919